MEDHHPHHLIFGVHESPSVDDLFAADKPGTLTDLPPEDDDKQLALHGANIISDHDIRDHVSDEIDFPEDYNALWLSLCDDISLSADDRHVQGGSDPGPSGTCDDHDHCEMGKDHRKYYAPESMEAPPPQNNDHDDDDKNLLRPLQIRAAPPVVPFNCSFCQVLREIIHVHYEYNIYMKLEIHGRIGVISHAIVKRKIANAANTTLEDDTQFEMLDKSTEEVKRFLTNYCIQRSEEGYVMSNDPLSTFYEALSVGLLPHLITHNSDFVSGGESDCHNSEQPQDQQQDIEQDQDQEQVNQPTTRNKRTKRNSKISLATQRKRTARLKLMDLREVFHLALVDASKEMEVCSTVLKKICRRDGINRWPYRKLDSVKKKIAELQQNLNSSDAEIRAEAEEKIDALRREAMDACGGINIL